MDIEEGDVGIEEGVVGERMGIGGTVSFFANYYM